MDSQFRTELESAVRSLGRRLWKLLEEHRDLAFGAGFGANLHAVASELYYKGGYIEILKPQGEYFGLAFMLAAYFAIRRQTKE